MPAPPIRTSPPGVPINVSLLGPTNTKSAAVRAEGSVRLFKVRLCVSEIKMAIFPLSFVVINKSSKLETPASPLTSRTSTPISKSSITSWLVAPSAISEITNVSEPAPPIRKSFPALIIIVSPPLPPSIKSFPALPSIWSFPAPPTKVCDPVLSPAKTRSYGPITTKF